jgi:hypothetical protein
VRAHKQHSANGFACAMQSAHVQRSLFGMRGLRHDSFKLTFVAFVLQQVTSGPEAGKILPPKVEGPAYVTRAFAICHLAMYDAYVGISRDSKTYLTYEGLPNVRKSAPPPCATCAHAALHTTHLAILAAATLHALQCMCP